MKYWIFACVLTTSVFINLQDVEAGGRRWRQRPAARYPVAGSKAYKQPRPRVYTPQELYWMDVYPKYYGAIHARSIHNYGIPPGDIGLRGSPW